MKKYAGYTINQNLLSLFLRNNMLQSIKNYLVTKYEELKFNLKLKLKLVKYLESVAKLECNEKTQISRELSFKQKNNNTCSS